MNILQNKISTLFISLIVQSLVFMPVFALDFDTTVNDTSRKNYSTTQTTQKRTVIQAKQENTTTPVQQTNTTNTQANIIQEQKPQLPKVPSPPKQTNSSTVAPVNNLYSGKMPNSEAIIPCNDIKGEELIIDKKYLKTKTNIVTQEKKKETKTKTQQTSSTASTYKKYRTTTLAKGTQVRAVNTTKLSDGMYEGQTVTFLTTQEIYTPNLKIPARTKLTARIVSSHLPQMTCNGGLIGLRIISANINGCTQPLDAGIIKIKTDNIYFSNLKGKHTYWKTTCKKAKWGQKIFTKWSGTARQLANKGACIIISPFPYVGGLATACASTITSPVTALLGKGERIIVPANTTFTIKLYEDAKIRY